MMPVKKKAKDKTVCRKKTLKFEDYKSIGYKEAF